MEGDLEGDLEREMEREIDRDSKGDFRGDMEGQTGHKRGLVVKLRSALVQAGLVQVWFRLQLEFTSSEIDSEVGRLVRVYINSF